MCYEWEWFQWRRAAATKDKGEQSKTLNERGPAPTQPEPIKPVTKPDEAEQGQKELQPV
jgi:hypothetical protein